MQKFKLSPYPLFNLSVILSILLLIATYSYDLYLASYDFPHFTFFGLSLDSFQSSPTPTPEPTPVPTPSATSIPTPEPTPTPEPEKEDKSVTEARKDPIFSQIIDQLGWDYICTLPYCYPDLWLGWTNNNHSYNYSTYGKMYLHVQAKSDEDKQFIYNTIADHGYYPDQRTSSNSQLFTNGTDILAIRNGYRADYYITHLGTIEEVETAEKRQDELRTTDSVFSPLLSNNESWQINGMNTSLTWHRHDELYGEYSGSLSITTPNTFSITNINLTEDEYQAARTQVENLLAAADYHIDPIRDWTYTYCGGETDAIIYTNGGQALLLGYNANRDYGDHSNDKYDLWLEQIGPLSLLEAKEKDYVIPAKLTDNERWTTGTPQKNPYTDDERYIVGFATHCGDDPIYYYKVEGSKGVILTKTLATYCDEKQYQEWLDDPQFDANDLQFLKEHCYPYNENH